MEHQVVFFTYVLNSVLYTCNLVNCCQLKNITFWQETFISSNSHFCICFMIVVGGFHLFYIVCMGFFNPSFVNVVCTYNFFIGLSKLEILSVDF